MDHETIPLLNVSLAAVCVVYSPCLSTGRISCRENGFLMDDETIPLLNVSLAAVCVVYSQRLSTGRISFEF